MKMKFNIILKTSRSVTIELENNEPYQTKNHYNLYINDKQIFSNENRNIVSVYNLLPNKEYNLILEDCLTFEKTNKIFKTEDEYVSLNVLDFNAKADGVTDDTMAIQCAIYACPKGGRVYIPKGTYLVKPLFLRSNITIELAKDARLLGVTDRNLYPILPGVIELNDESDDYNLGSWEGNPLDTFASIITGINIENVNIIGEGIIDANAQNGDWWDQPKKRNIAFRPRGMFLNHCKNISVQGVTVTNTPSWNLHPYFSDNVNFIDMKIINPKNSPNTDGCDPESCNGVNILGVVFSVGDDCIAIKAGKIYMGAKYKKPCQNLNIRNCKMQFGHGGVVLGSEMSGGIKNLTVNRCIFSETDRGLRIKSRRGRGKDAVIDDVLFENIYMHNVLTPFVMNMFYYCDPDGKTEYVYSKEKLPVDDRTPYFGSFKFKDILCDDCEVAAGEFWGLPEQPIKSIEIENVDFKFKDECRLGVPAMMSFVDPISKKGLRFNYVDSVSLKNVNIEGIDGESETLNFVNNFEKK